MAAVPTAIPIPLRSVAFPPPTVRLSPRPVLATLDCPDRIQQLSHAGWFAFVTGAFMLCVVLAAFAAGASLAGLLAGLAAVAAFAAWIWNFACAALVADRWVFDASARTVWREERPFGVWREKVCALDDVKRVVLHAVFEGAEGARYVWTPLVQLNDGRVLRSGSAWQGDWDGPHAAPEPPDHLIELGREISQVIARPMEIVLGRALVTG
jgi:hypothetical protein